MADDRRDTHGEPGPGQLLAGRYRLEETLGRGAVGIVSRARDVVAGRDVAVKLLLARDLTPAQAERFRREGELAAAVRHPGLVRVHDAGVAEDGRPFLVSELVEGARTLREVLPEVGLATRVELIRQAAEALAAAHAVGIVHRDVKPDNVLVDASGRARVTDFGAALHADLQRLTLTGAMIGTPNYMAPEQLDGEREGVGPAADVWSLGVLLYEAVTGVLPFPAATLLELSAKIADGRYPPPSDLAPDVPSGLAAVIDRCLRVDPAQRYRDGDEVALELEWALAHGSRWSRALRAQPVAVRRLVTLSAGLTAVALALVAGYLLYARPRREATRALSDALRWQAEVLDPWAWGLSLDPAPPPDPLDVARRRERVEQALARLGADAPSEARALRAELTVIERRLAGDVNAAGKGAPATAASRLEAALALREAGRSEEALQRVESARQLRPDWLPPVLLELRLLALVAPARFLRTCAEQPPRAERARELGRALLIEHTAAATRGLARRRIAAGEQELRRLREAARALDVPADHLAAQVQRGLEADAPAWAALLQRAPLRALPAHVQRLAAFLAQVAPATPGPALRAALEDAFGRSLKASLRPGAPTAVGMQTIALDEALTYGLELTGRGRPDYARLVRSIRPALRQDVPETRARFTLALLRVGLPVWAKNAVTGVPPAALEALRQARPRSQAAAFAAWLLGQPNPYSDPGGLAELRTVAAAGLTDLAPIYAGELELYIALRLSRRASAGPAEQEEVIRAARRARARLEAGDEQLRVALGHYQRGAWVLDTARIELEALRLLGRKAEVVAGVRDLVRTFQTRLQRLKRGVPGYVTAISHLAQARLEAARSLLDVHGDRAEIRELAAEASAASRGLGNAELTAAVQALQQRLERE